MVILATLTLTVPKLILFSCPLFARGGTIIPCQKPGDDFGIAEVGQVEVSALKGGGSSTAVMGLPARKLPTTVAPS